MNDIDPSSIPMICFSDGTELYMTAQHIDRRTDSAWQMTAVLGDVVPTRVAQAVVLVWRGRSMQAVLMSITPHGGNDFLATIAFHPDHPVILP